MRCFAQAEDAIHVMRHLSVGTVAETHTARCPAGRDGRLLPLVGQAIAQDPAVPVADVLGQGVVDPSRLRLCLPALYRCALHLAQGPFLKRREPPDVLQAERLYDCESHDRPSDAPRFT